jgi:guanylate kinase
LAEQRQEAARGPSTGSLYVIAAPSGGGKTTLVRALLEREPGIRLSVSCTTRPPRPGEIDGVHYHFVDAPAFHARKDAGEFLEHAYVHGHWYATSARWLAGETAAGRDVLLEIDWQGAAQIRGRAPDSSSIFILPPTLTELERRLRLRATDSEATIQRRLRDALADMAHWSEFEYLVINDDFDTAVEQLAEIVAGRGTGWRTASPQVRAAAEALLARGS